MKQKFKAPKAEIIKFDTKTDVIRTSGGSPAMGTLVKTGAGAGNTIFDKLLGK